MRVTLIGLLILGMTACQHGQESIPVQPRVEVMPPPTGLSPCLSFLETLNSMNIKELKVEHERMQKNAIDRPGEDDFRNPLAAGMYQARCRNFTRAFEILSPLANKKSIDLGCRIGIRLYSSALADIVQLDKDLLVEKRLKEELDRKIKGLSDIEKDIRQRDLKSHRL